VLLNHSVHCWRWFASSLSQRLICAGYRLEPNRKAAPIRTSQAVRAVSGQKERIAFRRLDMSSQ
jgi:transposase InsO family protein